MIFKEYHFQWNKWFNRHAGILWKCNFLLMRVEVLGTEYFFPRYKQDCMNIVEVWTSGVICLDTPSNIYRCVLRDFHCQSCLSICKLHMGCVRVLKHRRNLIQFDVEADTTWSLNDRLLEKFLSDLFSFPVLMKQDSCLFPSQSSLLCVFLLTLKRLPSQ